MIASFHGPSGLFGMLGSGVMTIMYSRSSQGCLWCEDMKNNESGVQGFVSVPISNFCSNLLET